MPNAVACWFSLACSRAGADESCVGAQGDAESLQRRAGGRVWLDGPLRPGCYCAAFALLTNTLRRQKQRTCRTMAGLGVSWLGP